MKNLACYRVFGLDLQISGELSLLSIKDCFEKMFDHMNKLEG